MKNEMYRIVFSNDAKKDIKELARKHRLVYRIYDEVIEVLVLFNYTVNIILFFLLFRLLPFLKISVIQYILLWELDLNRNLFNNM